MAERPVVKAGHVGEVVLAPREALGVFGWLSHIVVRFRLSFRKRLMPGAAGDEEDALILERAVKQLAVGRVRVVPCDRESALIVDGVLRQGEMDLLSVGESPRAPTALSEPPSAEKERQQDVDQPDGKKRRYGNRPGRKAS